MRIVAPGIGVMVGEVFIARVRVHWRLGVLDRAPVLFCARRNFADVGDDAVDVRAVDAIEALKRVQIGEASAIKAEVLMSFHLPHAVCAKADGLVSAHPQVGECEDHNQRVNHRRRKRHERTSADHVSEQRGPSHAGLRSGGRVCNIHGETLGKSLAWSLDPAQESTVGFRSP